MKERLQSWKVQGEGWNEEVLLALHRRIDADMDDPCQFHHSIISNLTNYHVSQVWLTIHVQLKMA